MKPTKTETHKDAPDPDQQKEEFLGRIVHQYGRARQNSKDRRFTASMVSGEPVKVLYTRSRILVSEGIKPPIQEAFDDLRDWTDERRVLERTGRFDKRGDRIHVLDMKNVIKAIAAGTVKRNRDFITCVFPDHHEKTPSMRLDYVSGIGYCFARREYAVFTPGETLEGSENNFKGGKRKRASRLVDFDVNKLVAPERHRQVIGLAAELYNLALNKDKEGRRGREYIAGRSLDPDMALEMNMGYASPFVLNRLMEGGVTYEELVKYGFIAFSESPKMSIHRGLYPELRRKGLTDEEIRFNNQGLPYVFLRGGITAPLMFNGDMWSIYMRTIEETDKHHRHLKLSIESNASAFITQGMFNEEVLYDGEDVIVTEGVFDALSWRELLGINRATALIGVGNHDSIQLIAKRAVERGAYIYIAMDTDTTGLASAISLTEELTEQGVSAENINNLTEEFLKTRPELVGVKDANEMLQLSKRIRQVAS